MKQPPCLLDTINGYLNRAKASPNETINVFWYKNDEIIGCAVDLTYCDGIWTLEALYDGWSDPDSPAGVNTETYADPLLVVQEIAAHYKMGMYVEWK